MKIHPSDETLKNAYLQKIKKSESSVDREFGAILKGAFENSSKSNATSTNLQAHISTLSSLPLFSNLTMLLLIVSYFLASEVKVVISLSRCVVDEVILTHYRDRSTPLCNKRLNN